MYPSISDLLKDLFGINIPLPVQSFGFFVAISFLLAAWTLGLELKRKESLKLILSRKIKTLEGVPASMGELITNGLIGFVLGYKLGPMIMHYGEFSRNPQALILSTDGSFLLGTLLAAFLIWTRYREKQKTKLDKPVWVEKEVFSHQLVGNFAMIAAIAGIIGAKIFHNLENLDDFRADPWGSLVSFSGLTFYGGLIVAGIAVIYYGKRNGIKPLLLCDAAAPGLMLAYGVGRIGCQIAGDGDWGINNPAPKPGWMSWLPDWVWSFRYPHNVIGDGVPIPGCVGKHCNMLTVPVFPTPFYEAIMGILLFIFLWSIRKRFSTPGILFFIYLIVNGIERYFIEKIRVNTTYPIFGGTTQAEIISVLLVIAGVAGIFMLRSNRIAANTSSRNKT